MEKEFVPYELALRMKQLGFDEECFGYYSGPKTKHIGLIWYEMPNKGQDSIPVGNILAPTFSQAFRWFRENGFICHITNDLSNNLKDEIYVYVMTKGYGTLIDRSEEYFTYEEAELACLKYCIEILESKSE